MQYDELLGDYELKSTPGNLLDCPSLAELIKSYGYKVLKVRRQTWVRSYVIVDTVWYPSKDRTGYCKIYGNACWSDCKIMRHELDYVYKPGWWEVLQVSDIDMIVTYGGSRREGGRKREKTPNSCP
jgi:hypothetical protein